MDNSILAYNLWIRIFPDIGFSKKTKNHEIFHFLDYFQQKPWQKLYKNLFWAYFAHLKKNTNFTSPPFQNKNKNLALPLWMDGVTEKWRGTTLSQTGGIKMVQNDIAMLCMQQQKPSTISFFIMRLLAPLKDCSLKLLISPSVSSLENMPEYKLLKTLEKYRSSRPEVRKRYF